MAENGLGVQNLGLVASSLDISSCQKFLKAQNYGYIGFHLRFIFLMVFFFSVFSYNYLPFSIYACLSWIHG